MAFIERCSEIDRLKDFYGRAVRGKAQIVLVDGAVASGKTELLHVFGERVVESDGILLTAVGSREEPTVAFEALGQLFLDSRLPAETRHTVGALLSEHTAAAGAAPADRADATPRLARALCDVLLALCARQPVVIGVDDVQHVDEATLHVLLYVLRRLRTNRLMVVLNEWTGPRPAHPAFRAELLRRPECHRIRLRLLSTAGVLDSLSALLDRGTATRLAPEYHAVSGGNPLLLRGLVEDGAIGLPDGSRTLSDEPVPEDSFRQAVFACLYRWDGDTIDVARGLAMLGPEAAPGLIGELTGLDGERVRQSLDTLTESGLLDRGWFRHPAVRTVAMDSLGVENRVRLHLAAARLLHDNGQSAVDVARHVVAAGRVREDWSVAVLQDAAAHATAEDRLDFALECLELAYRACEEPHRRAWLTLTLTRLKWRNQPSAAAHHLAPLCQALVAGHLDARHGADLVRYLLWHGRGAEALDTYEWLARSEAAGDPALAAELRLIRPWLEPVRSFDEPADPDAIPAVERVGTRVHGGLVSAAAAESLLYRGPNEQAVEQAERVLADATLSDASLMAVGGALHTLIRADRPDRAKPWCQTFLAEARARRSATWEALISGLRAEAALRQGDLTDAEHWAGRALDLLSPHNWGVFIGQPLSVLLLARTGLGHYEDAAATLRQHVPESMYRSRWAAVYLHARGHYHLAARRSHAALADFRTCGELMAAWAMDSPVLVPWRSDCAQAQIQLGKPLQARALVEEQLALPSAGGSRTRGLSLRVLARTHPVEHRPAMLRQAVALLQTSGDAMELLLALADLGLAHRALGDLDLSRMLERRVMRLARECGAEERGRRLFDEGDGTPDGVGQDSGSRQAVGHDGDSDGADAGPAAEPADGPPALSDAERRVAELAARGHTNRQISHELYITVSTVEQHLTRVYRKLNVTRRTDLPLWLREDGFEPPRLVTADGLSLPRPDV
jgi:DNA-binding CsgD family transcriptional regulator/tetratricopeptide (TPR) repeat protein